MRHVAEDRQPGERPAKRGAQVRGRAVPLVRVKKAKLVHVVRDLQRGQPFLSCKYNTNWSAREIQPRLVHVVRDLAGRGLGCAQSLWLRGTICVTARPRRSTRQQAGRQPAAFHGGLCQGVISFVSNQLGRRKQFF